MKKGFKQTEVGLIPEDWEVVSYNDVFNFLRTASIPRSELSGNEEIKYVHYGDIHVRFNHFLRCSESLPTISKLKAKRYSLVKNGDIIMADASEDYEGIGKSVEVINLNDLPVISGLHTFLLRDKDDYFVNGYKAFIDKNIAVRSAFKKLATGLKVYGISKTILKSIQIPLPPKPEQTAIAQVLSDTDALIDGLKALIDKKLAMKQGAMQELLTGKTRLKDENGKTFEGEWEEKMLGEIGKCIRGVSYSGDSDLFESETTNSIKLLRSNNIFQSKISFHNLQNVNRDCVKEHQIILENDTLICMANGSKDLVGKAAFCNNRFDIERYTFGAFMGIYRIRENVNPYFIFVNFQTKNYRNYIDLLLTGSSINNLKPSDIEQIKILLPSLKEQTAIAQVLSDMDAEIELLEVRLQKTEQLKQGMMQELLTGRTRLDLNQLGFQNEEEVWGMAAEGNMEYNKK